ncbi:MAG: rhomboid family intramembrane serine protease [Bacteroidetes bacterium]|nr:rhomboid family intramembrane serine protease [Bacteroidota bacterium]
MFNITPLVRTLIIINVVVFILQQMVTNLFTGQLANGQQIQMGLTDVLSLWSMKPNLFVGFFKPYQFFTYMFAHGGFGHIFFNMLALASFAPILETYWGEKKFLFFYLATGIGAGIIYSVINYFFFPGDGQMLGASGALYGVLMAFGLVFPNMELMLLFPPIPIKAKYMVFVIGGITYFMDRSGTVAHLAHFGGAFVAFLIINYWKTQGGR